MATKRRRTTRPAKKSNDGDDKNFVNAGAIWERTSKKGDTYLAISLDPDVDLSEFITELPNGNTVISLAAFTNGFKEEDKHPDFNVVAFKD